MKPDENGRIDFNEFLKFNNGDLNDGQDKENQAKNFFAHLDSDKNGLICFDEFKQFADIHPKYRLLMTNQAIENVFDQSDKDKDGKIDFNGIYF